MGSRRCQRIPCRLGPLGIFRTSWGLLPERLSDRGSARLPVSVLLREYSCTSGLALRLGPAALLCRMAEPDRLSWSAGWNCVALRDNGLRQTSIRAGPSDSRTLDGKSGS
jgi:hypothetical protein